MCGPISRIRPRDGRRADNEVTRTEMAQAIDEPGILPEAKSYPYAPAPGPVGLYLSMMYTYVIHTFACGSCRAACGAHSLRRVLTLTYLSLLLVL
jgi:hypothetical protein